jgi:hypothetical protein
MSSDRKTKGPASPAAPNPSPSGVESLFHSRVDDLQSASKASGRVWLLASWEQTDEGGGKSQTGFVNEELLSRQPEALIASLDQQMQATVALRWMKHAPGPYVGLDKAGRLTFLVTRLLSAYVEMTKASARRLIELGVPPEEVQALLQRLLEK